MLKRNATSLLAAASMLLAGACGSSGPSTNLKTVFFRTVNSAPVATLTMQRFNGSPLTQGRATFDTRTQFDGWLMVGRTTTASANSSGVAALALTAGTYPVRIDPRVSQSTALVGTLNDTLAISQDTNRTYQTSQQGWTISSAAPFSSLHIAIYQVDSDGKMLVGTQSQPLNGSVLSATPVSGANLTSATFSTELFKGSYRAVITATPVNSTDTIAPFETAVFNAAGGGATEPQNVTLTPAANVVSLQFVESSGVAVPPADIGDVVAFDASSLIPLGFVAAGTNSVATVSTGSVTSVLAVVESPDGETLAAGTYTASPTHSATLTRYSVTGHAKAPSGQLTANNTNDYGTMTAALQTGLPDYWQRQVSPVAATITDALGTYTMKLFAGSWKLQATNLKNLPTSALVALTVAADVPAQDVAVDAGGVVTGNLHDQAQNNISGVHLAVIDANHATVGTATTDASGNYSIPVPFGTYEVFANGALTRDVSVSSGAATRTLNLTRFQINGRLTDAAQAPVAGNVSWGGGSVAATTLGTYTVNVIEGVNWFLMQAPSTSPSLGFAYENNVLINADTVKALQ